MMSLGVRLQSDTCSSTVGPKGASMPRKRSLAVVLAIAGIALIAAAAASAAPAAKTRRRSSSRSRPTSTTSTRSLYYGETWKLEAATACKLMNWRDKEGRQVLVATPEVAAGLPIVSRDGRTYTFTIKPGFRFSNGRPVNARRLRRRVQPLRQPADAVDGRAVPRHRAGRPGRDRREARTISGVRSERQQAHRPADEGVAPTSSPG